MTFLMKFQASSIASGSTPVTIFQPGEFMQVWLLYAFCQLTIPTTLTSGDEVFIYSEDENGHAVSQYSGTGSQTAAGTYTGAGDVVPNYRVNNWEQWNTYPRLFNPSKLLFYPPAQSGDTGAYYVMLLCKEMQGDQ